MDSIGGRNCTVHEFFPRYRWSLEKSVGVSKQSDLLNALWKSGNGLVQGRERFKVGRFSFAVG